MKKMIMLVGLATLLASPAFAQAPAGVYGTGNIIFPGNPSAAAAAGAYGTMSPGAAGIFAGGAAAGAGAFAYEPVQPRAYSGPRQRYQGQYRHYRHWSDF